MTELLDRLQADLADRYRIERELGQGGMATVYLAEDLKHHRQVALKVLRPDLSALLGAERFLKEIEVTANLQHPHLLPLFDSGEAAGLLFYVMPYLTGESLRQKLVREKQLGIAEAVRIATQVASALDYAHRRNVIHRDIKPENILLQEGQALIADFGIALALRQAGGNRLTETGLSLGTPRYMSPEQATGDRELDARSDVYSLGCVLYEMLAGEPPHTGPTVQAVIAKVLTDRPRLVTELRSTVPVYVAEALEVALAKLPADRFATAAEFAAHLQGASPFALDRGVPGQPRKPRVARGALRWVAALAVVGWIAAAVLLVREFRPAPSPPPAQVMRFKLELPADAPLVQPRELTFGIDRGSLAISPDGRRLSYVALKDGVRQLYVRQLDELQFRPLPGTEGAVGPFFRPDGEWLGFFSAGKLKKAAFDGGSVSELADVFFAPSGASWHPEGWILFSIDNGDVYRVPAEGGAAVFDSAWSDPGLCRPRIQPDGDSVLGNDCITGEAQALSLASGAVRALGGTGGDPSLSSTGHLVAAAQGVLRAAPFDPRTGRITGDEVTVLEGLRTTLTNGAQYALSETGTLLYALGGATDDGRLVSVDRSGVAGDLAALPGIFHHVAAAADGNRVAVAMKDGAGVNVFTLDLRRPFWNRLTSEGAADRTPIWNAGGDSIAFCSDRGGVTGVWVQAADGGSAARQLAEARDCHIFDWSRDGRSLILGGVGPRSNFVLQALDVGGRSEPRTLFDSGSDVAWGVLDRDQRWLLYICSRSGVSQVCLRSWSDPSSREIQISTEGGGDPLWSRDGREIFYRNADQFMVVALPATPGSLDGWIPRPRLMFRGDYLNVRQRPWDVMPDGQHFLMIQPTHPDPPRNELYLVVNWFEELKAKVPKR
jgi:eukaryotic-like serine/threonine-protein kinase